MNFIKNFLSHFQNNDVTTTTEAPETGEFNLTNALDNIDCNENEDLLTSQSSDDINVLEANETDKNNPELLKTDGESPAIPEDAKAKKDCEDYNMNETLINLDDFDDLFKDFAATEDVIVVNSEVDAFNILELNDAEVNNEECKDSTTKEVRLEYTDNPTDSLHEINDEHKHSSCNKSNLSEKSPKHFLDEFKSFLKNNAKEVNNVPKTYFAMNNVSSQAMNPNNSNLDSERTPEKLTNFCHNTTDTNSTNTDVGANQGDMIETQNESNISDRNKDMTKDATLLSSEDETNSTRNDAKPLDAISISSSDDEREKEDSDYCSGYHSSDFEFITESEAELDGLIINLTSKVLKTPDKRYKPETYTVQIAKDPKYASGSSQESVEVKPGPSHPHFDINYSHAQKQDCTDGIINKNVPVTSTTKQDANIEKNYSYDYKNYLIQESKKQRQNHVMPQGEEYLNLFQGMYLPLISELQFLENKSVRPRTCMNLEYEGIGFDMRLVKRPHESDDEYKEEAEDTAKKILSMYPGENRRRRRRY